eukprot:CAMPEP_0168615100 /NCGR_PEP_ID=MMETSP0449_2-20121227/4327_1 /TAXON_ID=1082188 /ORGANISM="Strombidium rassoulzadegani, Strain ras09" /LENGTH=99 /DNA_ID=CAMNT_0008655823 /DNA_START=651 /DNA_END=950 /DNA_ORIENTATION=-
MPDDLCSYAVGEFEELVGGVDDGVSPLADYVTLHHLHCDGLITLTEEVDLFEDDCLDLLAWSLPLDLSLLVLGKAPLSLLSSDDGLLLELVVLRELGEA